MFKPIKISIILIILLYIPELLVILISNLSIDEIIKLSSVNRELYNQLNKNFYWCQIYKNYLNVEYIKSLKQSISIKNIIVKNYIRHENRCSLCKKHIFENFYITLHKCSKILNKCINCNQLLTNCKCSYIEYYHIKCVNQWENINLVTKDKLHLLNCETCSDILFGYKIRYNI